MPDSQDNNRFVTGRRNKGERKDEEVMDSVAEAHTAKVIAVQNGRDEPAGRERESRSDQLCSCRALCWLTFEMESACGIF